MVLRHPAAMRPAADSRRAAVRTSWEPGLPGEGLILPPGPHEVDAAEVMVAEISSSSQLGEPAPGIFPDGSLTGEWYRSPAYEASPGSCGQIVRMAHRVSGQAIGSLDDDGLLEAPGLTWVVGQAAGASMYLESLAGGARVARHVAGAIMGVGSAPLEGCAEPRLRGNLDVRLGADRV